MTRYDDETKAAALHDYVHSDLSLERIGDKHNVSGAIVWKWATAAKLERKTKTKPRNGKSKRTRTTDKSPQVLRDEDGAWLYGTDGIARWVVGAQKQEWAS